MYFIGVVPSLHMLPWVNAYDVDVVLTATGRMYEYNTSTGERRWIKGRALAERGASPPPSYVSHL